MKGFYIQCIVGTLLFVCLLSLSWAQPPKGSVVLNEVVVDSRGGNPELEFIELYSQKPGQSIGGLSVICIEGEYDIPDFPVKTILRKFDIPQGDATNNQGFYLISNQRTSKDYNVKPNIQWSNLNKIPNDAMTIALAATKETPAEGEMINPNSLFPSGIWDSVALVKPSTRRDIFFNAPIIGPEGKYLPAGATRIRDGVDTDQSGDWAMADIEAPPQSYNTPGKSNAVPTMILSMGTSTDAPFSDLTGPPASTTSNQGAVPSAPSQAPISIYNPSSQQSTPTPMPTRSQAPAQVQWSPYSVNAVRQALWNRGNVLVYIRSDRTNRCLDFENNYLLTPRANSLIAGKPLFYLNLHEPGSNRLAYQLGVFKVPALIFARKGGEPEYLYVNPDTPTQQIYTFLGKQ